MKLRFLPDRAEAEKLRITVGDQVLFNRALHRVEVLGMRFCHLRNVVDGTLVKFARLTDCHKITGDESPMDSFAGTVPYNRDSLVPEKH